MKFTLYFKTPDVLDDVINNLDKEQRKLAVAFAKQYLYYDECIEIEFDTDAETVKVLPAR